MNVNVTERWNDLIRESQRGSKGWFKEFLTRSEGPELFTTILNDKLWAGLGPELLNTIESIYDVVTIDQGTTVRFPSNRGINPDFVPEGAEYQRADWEITGVEVQAQKFGILLGITKEMMDQAQLPLMGRQALMAGMAHRDLRRREHAKCLSFFSTGTTKSTGTVGLTPHGAQYFSAGGYTNQFSASAAPFLSWEARINVAMVNLANQRVTITAKGIDIPFPVTPDTIVANPHHMMDIKKVLSNGITVVSVGISTGAGSNVAGGNVFNGVISNQVYDPEIPTGQAFILKQKIGLVSLRRSGLELEEFENFYFDATDLKSREQFLPAVIEDRYIQELQITG